MRIIPWKQSREDCSRAGEKCNLCHWGVCGRACRLLQLLCTGLRGVGQGGSRCGKWNGAPGVEQLQYLAPVEGQPLFRCQLRFRGRRAAPKMPGSWAPQNCFPSWSSRACCWNCRCCPKHCRKSGRAGMADNTGKNTRCPGPPQAVRRRAAVTTPTAQACRTNERDFISGTLLDQDGNGAASTQNDAIFDTKRRYSVLSVPDSGRAVNCFFARTRAKKTKYLGERAKRKKM